MKNVLLFALLLIILNLLLAELVASDVIPSEIDALYVSNSSMIHSNDSNSSVANRLTSTSSAGWLSGGWLYRKAITIDESKVDANLTDFPVLVKLTSNNFNFSKALANGYDIRFTSSDGITLLKYERERHSSPNAEYWVKIPSISSSVNTVFYMYYGNSGATNSSDPANVWDTNYKAVWHMPDASTTTIADSKGTNTGTKKGVNEPIEVDGKIGKAQNFDGSDDKITIATPSGIPTAGITWELWFNPDIDWNTSMTPSYTAPFGEYKSGTERVQIFYQKTDGTFYWTYYSPNTIFASKQRDFRKENWYYVAVTWNGTTNVMYINGVEVANSSISHTGFYPSTPSWYIGTENICPLDGKVDEMRISNIGRSSAWIKASFNSENNSLLSFYTEQSNLNFIYRKEIIIDNTATPSILYDYQILLTLNTQSIYSHCQTNGEDLRFTTSTDWNDHNWDISYPYFIESGWNSTSTKIWVKVDNIPASANKTIYMYYSNSLASSVQNGDDTFIFFDDFSGNLNKWRQETACDPGYSIISGELDVPANTGLVTNSVFFTRPFIYEFKIKRTAIPTSGAWLATVMDENIYGWLLRGTYTYANRNSSGYTTVNSIIWDADQWYNAKFVIKNQGSGSAFRWSGSDYSDSNDPAGNSMSYIRFGDKPNNVVLRVDNVRIRKYATSEPTSSSGAEEFYGIPITIDWNNGNVQTITLLDNAQFTFTNGQAGASYKLIIAQGGSGGYIVSFPSSVKWLNASIPTLSTTVGYTDMIVFTYDGTKYLSIFYQDFR